MTNISKKFLTAVGILAILATPLASQASVLGIATSGDIANIQSQIAEIQIQITQLQSELASTTTKLGSQLPSSPALVDTYLAAGIQPTDTSMVLANGQTSDGVSLAGYMCFTIDVNTPQLEYVCGNASGTAVTGMTRGLGFWNPNTTSSALAFIHRRLASVQSTDYPTLQLIVRQLTAQDGVSSTNPLFYDHTEICTSPNQICPKSYIDSVASSGAPDASPSVKGLVIVGNTQTAPTSTDGLSILYSIISSQYYSSVFKAATTSVVMTNGSGYIDPSFVAGQNYNLGSTTVQSITSASTTLNGSTTINGTIIGLTGINFFGDGSNGSTTISATTTLTKDAYYTNLTVNSTLITGGYRIFVNGTLSGNGIIMAPIPNAGAQSTSSATSSINGYFINLPGGAGDGGNGSIASSSLGSTGGSGGAGGTGNNGAGSGGGTSPASSTFNKFGLSSFDTISMLDISPTKNGFNIVGSGSSGAGGGTGGAGSAGTAGHGSSGGASTVPVLIAAKNWGGSFTIEDIGANGGAGGSCTGSSPGGGGGGGGSAGGTAITVYQTKTWTGTYLLTGGIGGTGGGCAGVDVGGSNGSNGATGTFMEIPISTFSLP